MSVSKRSIVFALASAAAAATAAAGLVTGPASAAQQTPAARMPKTWTIAPGGATTAATTFAEVEDTTSGRSILCQLSVLRITLKSGKRRSGAHAGTLTSGRFGACTTLHGLPVIVSLGHLPWHLNLLSYNARKGVTTGALTGIHVSIWVPALGCTAIADGTSAHAHDGVLAATYKNKTATLTARRSGGELRVYDVSHCSGVIENGDSIALSASYAVRPFQKITGP